MSYYLNLGNGEFQKYIDDDIYVDKTGFISYTNRRMSKGDCYLCVSRPRRFGKSLTCYMLEAYYSRKCDSHSQFDGMTIASDSSYEKHINKYNVIYVNVAELISNRTDVETGLTRFKEELIDDLKTEYPETAFKKEELKPMLKTVYDETKVGFVFIIDEWDCPLRMRKNDTDGQDNYMLFLKDLLKGQEYVAFVYMTGILPIKKNWSESDLNMFMEISMTNASPLQEYTGFIEKEVKALCSEHSRSFEEFDWWYDGYIVNGESIYNPKSVVESLRRGVSDNYWTSTQSFESLKSYIGENTFGIYDTVINLLSGGVVETDTAKFQNDMVTFKSQSDVLTLLVHLGYLTYDFDSKTVAMPNHEINSEFVSVIDDIGWENYISDYEEKKKVLDATLAGDEKTVAEIIARTHRAYAEKYSNNEATLSAVLRESYAPALKNYSMVPEMPAGGGIADYILIPNKKIPDKPLIVLELKSKKNATVEGAIDQIKKNHYDEALSAYTGEILLVGISYDTVRGDHDCMIEKTEKTK